MIEWAPLQHRQAFKGVQWWKQDSRLGRSRRTVTRRVLRSAAIAFVALCLSLGTATAAGYFARDTVVIRSLRAVWSDVLQAVVREGSEPAVDSGSHLLENGLGQSEEAPGHDEEGPGQSEEAPGHDEEGPGQSKEAPGHDEEGLGSQRKPPVMMRKGLGSQRKPPVMMRKGLGSQRKPPVMMGKGLDSQMKLRAMMRKGLDSQMKRQVVMMSSVDWD